MSAELQEWLLADAQLVCFILSAKALGIALNIVFGGFASAKAQTQDGDKS